MGFRSNPVAGAIEVGGHHLKILGVVLADLLGAHLQAGDLGQSAVPISVLQRAREKVPSNPVRVPDS
jgi:hypothetical protein